MSKSSGELVLSSGETAPNGRILARIRILNNLHVESGKYIA